MNIDYFAVLPSGPKGALQTHCLTNGPSDARQDEDWERAVHYGAGIIRVRDSGVELRIPIEFGFGYVLQYFKHFLEAEQKERTVRERLQAQLDWIGRALPVQLRQAGKQILLEGETTHRFPRTPFLEALRHTMKRSII